MHLMDKRRQSEHVKHRPATARYWPACVLLGLAGAAFPIWLLSDLLHVSDTAATHALVRLGFLLTAIAIGQQLVAESPRQTTRKWIWVVLPVGLWATCWPILDFEAAASMLPLAVARNYPWWDSSIVKWGGGLTLLVVGCVMRRLASRS